MAEVKFDPLSPETLANPGPAYSELRAACPFHHHVSEQHDFFVLSDYNEIKNSILQDNPVWTFRFGNAAKDSISDVGFKTDPPFHNAFRMAVLSGFAPRLLESYNERIHAIVNELIDKMLATGTTGSGDFFELFALPLPARMMCVMLGAPEENYLRYKEWADLLQFLIFHDPQPGSYEPILKEIYPHFGGLIGERRSKLREAGITEPDLSVLGKILPNDFLSRILVTKIEDRYMTDEEMLNVCLAFLTGGQETTASLIANLLWRLLEEPARWERLKAEPNLVESAIEESLRYDPPVLAHFRTSLCPVEMHGETVPEHGKLMFSIAGANRDPAVFADPEEFKIDRSLTDVKKHISFGSGVHFCIGSSMARLEAKIAFETIIRRLPNLRLEGESERIKTWMYWGRSKLPVAWG
jgi:cytochrome P450